MKDFDYVGEFAPNGWIIPDTIPWWRKEKSETFMRKATGLMFSLLNLGWKVGVIDESRCKLIMCNSGEERTIDGPLTEEKLKEAEKLYQDGWYILNNYEFLLLKGKNMIKLPCASKRAWCYTRNKVRTFLVTQIDVKDGQIIANGNPFECKETIVRVSSKVRWVSYGEK